MLILSRVHWDSHNNEHHMSSMFPVILPAESESGQDVLSYKAFNLVVIKRNPSLSKFLHLIYRVVLLKKSTCSSQETIIILMKILILSC